MNASTKKNAPLRPIAGEAPGSDFFYDELMTAQPEATRDFYRARLAPACDPIRKATGKASA